MAFCADCSVDKERSGAYFSRNGKTAPPTCGANPQHIGDSMAESFKEITDENFEAEIAGSEKPVLVDFWAPWCGPCKAIGPMLEDLAGSYGDQVDFTKCNVDDNPVTPGKFGIKSIPTLIFFKDGKVKEQITGMVARQKVEDSINNVLAGKGGSPFVS